MPFHLLRLPVVAIEVVFGTMGFIEMFVLASVSRRTKRILKRLVRVQNNELKLFLEKGFFVFDFRRIDSPPDTGASIYLESIEKEPRHVFQLQIGNSDQVSAVFCNASNGTIILTIYWNLSIHNATKLYHALFELFKLAPVHLDMDLKGVAVETYRSWISWNNDLFQDVATLDIVGNCSFTGYLLVWKDVRTKHKLIMRVEPTEYPEDPESFETSNVEVPCIIIHYGRWISIRHLRTIYAASITIGRATLTDRQVNEFLRSWRDSEVGAILKELVICLDREANPMIVLEGLDPTEENVMKPDDAISQWSFRMRNRSKCTLIYAEYESSVPEFGLEFYIGK